MVNPVVTIILLTLAPFFELRASIPFGVFATNIHWFWVFFLAVVVNILLAPIIFFVLKHLLDVFLRIDMVDRYYQRTVIKTQKKVHPYIEKYGVLGLALFIGIPLPGSGVYSGTLAAYLLGFKFRDLLIASILGVLIAGTIVLVVSLSGSSLFSLFIKGV